MSARMCVCVCVPEEVCVCVLGHILMGAVDGGVGGELFHELLHGRVHLGGAPFEESAAAHHKESVPRERDLAEECFLMEEKKLFTLAKLG